MPASLAPVYPSRIGRVSILLMTCHSSLSNSQLTATAPRVWPLSYARHAALVPSPVFPAEAKVHLSGHSRNRDHSSITTLR